METVNVLNFHCWMPAAGLIRKRHGNLWNLAAGAALVLIMKNSSSGFSNSFEDIFPFMLICFSADYAGTKDCLTLFV